MGLIDLAKSFSTPVRNVIEQVRLPAEARRQRTQDRSGPGAHDPGAERVIQQGIEWLKRAQDQSPQKDGGVARHYSLVSGWGSSYPETTGYIVPTLIDWYVLTGDDDALYRAKRMLDWFVFIQIPDGGIQGGTVDSMPKVPVTFNTGQILLGLAAGAQQFGSDYLKAMHRAAQWLRKTQDEDGAWRRFPTPFAASGDKAYETHVAWGLLEADVVAPGHGYADSANANIRWAITKQRDNGWFSDCCLSKPATPLTHTIGYVLRGILEGWRHLGDRSFLDSANACAEGILSAMDESGYLPGRLDDRWQPAADWVCLTGNAQIAHCLLLLYQESKDKRYLRSAQALNHFVRRTIDVEGTKDFRGAVKGSFPVFGLYGKYEFLNWAVKFVIDANLLEKSIAASTSLAKSADWSPI